MTRKRIVLIIPRGEAVRNFLYSDTLRCLSEEADVTLLSVITDEKFTRHFAEHAAQILPLDYVPEKPIVNRVRHFVGDLHFQWLGSEVARNHWETEDFRANTPAKKVRRLARRALVAPLAQRPLLQPLTRVEQSLTYRLRPTQHFDQLFAELQPDLVFNGSHIHGAAGTLPVRVAHKMGISTAGFIFSWDNLTSRSRIFEPYDDYLVWHPDMKALLLDIYGGLSAENVHVTGTPQMDFHFDKSFRMSRGELAAHVGFDPSRPYVLYTTGIDRHFPDEHIHVRFVAEQLRDTGIQLVVRTYIKGISPEMHALAAENLPDVYFPPMLWEKQWRTPLYRDLRLYTSLLRECIMGINPASTVSLELMMHDKPVMNIGFDPPGSNLPHHLRWSRHIDFDHYKPVAEGGGVRVAWSQDDMAKIMRTYLAVPDLDSAERCEFITKFFGTYPDGNSAKRVAQTLLNLAR